MIVKEFLSTLNQAASGERANAASALAHAYLWSSMSEQDKRAAEGVMVYLLDDPSPLVREGLARALGAYQEAPQSVIYGLLNDLPSIAAIIVESAPQLADAELIEVLSRGNCELQTAIANRDEISSSVAAAIAEIGSASACLALLENANVEILTFSIMRICERHGEDGKIRELLISDPRLPIATRHILMEKLAAHLTSFVSQTGWLEADRARKLTSDATEAMTIELASCRDDEQLGQLVSYLCDNNRLTAALLLKAACLGNFAFLKCAFHELTGMKQTRIASILSDKSANALRAIYMRAGLPETVWPAFQLVIATLHRFRFNAISIDDYATRQRVLVEVISQYSAFGNQGRDEVLVMLKQFQAEVAREEARSYCDDLSNQQQTFDTTHFEEAVFENAA